MATRDMMLTRQATGKWIKEGAIGGVIAGVVFALFEMVMAAILDGTDAFWMPLRMIGAMVIGEEAMMPGYSLLNAAGAGILVHMMLSLVFGVGFGLAAAVVPALARTTGVLLGSASLYGLLLWLVNFYAIAPVAGWDWFPDETEVWVQFLAHTIFFGTVLGLVVERAVTPHRAR